MLLTPDSAKNGEKCWVPSKIRKTAKTVCQEKVLHLENNSRFLQIDHTDDPGKITLVFAEKEGEYLLTSRTPPPPDCIFKNSPRQFAHLCNLYVGLLSILGWEVHISGPVSTFTRQKRNSVSLFVNSAEGCVFLAVTKNYEGRF
jgi:hypothetical protein